MTFQEAIKELEGFDVNDLDFENVGSWPIIVKAVVWVIAFSAVIALGYFYDIEDLQKFWDVYPGLKADFFEASERDDYSSLKVKNEQIKTFIFVG